MRPSSKLFVAFLLLVASLLGHVPEGLLAIPFLVGDTEEGGEQGGDAGADDGGGAPPATEEPPARPTPWADKMKALREEVAQEQAAAAAAARSDLADVPLPGQEQAGDDDPGEQGTPPEGSKEELPEGEGGEEADEGAERATDDAVVFVGLPARNQGDEDFELPIDVEFLEAIGINPVDVVERLNQLKNGYGYMQEAREVQQAVEADRAELDAIYDGLSEDPAGFILEHVSADHRSALLDELLLDLPDEALNAAATRISRYLRDPDKRTLARAEAQLARTKKENQRLSTGDERRQQQEYTRELRTSISSVVPEGTAKNVADLFVRTAARELELYAHRKKVKSLEPSEIPAILAEIGLVETFKFPAPGAEGAKPNGNGARGSAAPPPRKLGKKPDVGGETPPAKGARLDRAKVTDVRDRLKRRKSAAATAPSGAGSAVPAGFQKVQGESYLDRRNRIARALGLKEKKEL